MKARLMLAALVLIVAGCVTPPSPEPEQTSPPSPELEQTSPPSKPDEPSASAESAEREARLEPERAPSRADTAARLRSEDLERLLSYFEHVRKLPAAELVRESESARAAFMGSRADFDRMRLAILISIPNTALNDDQRAADLLNPLVKNESSSLHGLALVMSAHLQERRRLETGMQGLQQNVQRLQQKLDALMSLERSLIDREQSTPPRKR
jgi:hypothetical protein